MRTCTKAAGLGLLAMLAIAGCSNPGGEEEEGTIGALGLNLMLGAAGAEIDLVHYAISGNGVDMQGDIDTSNVPGDTVGMQIGGIPAGMGFTLTLTAISTDGETACEGSAMFDIQRETITTATVAMSCQGRGRFGSLRADATFNDCPIVDNLTVLPTGVLVGAPIHVFTAVSDAEGDPLTVAWTTTDGAGTFVGPTALDTFYNCTVPGPHTIRVTVSDNDVGCEPQYYLEAVVTCIPVACGDGDLDAGEECDPPGTATCDANCQRVPTCGDTNIDAPETCDDGNATSCDGCSASCQPDDTCGDGVQECGEGCDDGNTTSGDGCSATCASEGCGNGTIDAGETCDDGNTTSGDGCSATCAIEMAMCGNGVVESFAGETCDPPNLPVGTQQCSGSCTLTADACVACQATQCTNFIPFGGVNLVADCFMQPAPGNVQCANFVSCMISSGCADGGAPLSDCLCGAGVDPTPSACSAQGGPCAMQARTAFGTMSTSELLERFVSPDYPGGDATRLVQCDQFACSAACGL